MSELQTARYSPSTVRAPGVLVADDEREIRDALDWALRREGFAVWVAADGTEAVDLFRSQASAIDVVLLDVRMPRMDGPATLVALRALSPRVPCCFMTGDLGAYTEADLRNRGALAVLRKPLRIPVLADVLRSAAEGTRTDAGGRAWTAQQATGS